MQKKILLTGATDGIGLETAKLLVSKGHQLLIHGRNATKLDHVARELASIREDAAVETYVADLSRIEDVEAFAQAVREQHDHLDVLINNAGVYKTAHPITKDGLDVRFVVNTVAPYLLTQRLLPLLNNAGRVVNLSSAAQAPVNLNALTGKAKIDDMGAYAQSKLAITMWSQQLADTLKDGPVMIAVNPGSLLASKMVKEGFGVAGKDLGIGANILVRASLDDEFTDRSGQYFDNDEGRFAPPHPDAADAKKREGVVQAIESVVAQLSA